MIRLSEMFGCRGVLRFLMLQEFGRLFVMIMIHSICRFMVVLLFVLDFCLVVLCLLRSCEGGVCVGVVVVVGLCRLRQRGPRSVL